YEVTGAVRVAPILPNILTGEADRGVISNYYNFMNTQAEMITSSRVVQRVADELAHKNLTFFSGQSVDVVTKLKHRFNQTPPDRDPETILKEAISRDVIQAVPLRNTELLEVKMKSPDPEEARQIVNAFIQAYWEVEVSASTRDQDRELSLLDNERKVLAQKLHSQHNEVRKLAEEYGTAALEGRHDMMLQRVTALQAELTKVEARRIGLEVQVELLEKADQQVIAPEELLTMRNGYVNEDPTTVELTKSIVQLEQELIADKLTLAPGNPTLKQKQEFFESFMARLQERRRETADEFDRMAADAIQKAGQEKLANARQELEQTRAYEQRLRHVVGDQDTQTRKIGHKQLNIDDLKFQLALDEEYYETVRRRIRALEIERKGPARVSIAYKAEVVAVHDKRIKFSMALVFAAAACGMMLAVFRDKADLCLRTPEDVAKRIGIRIIGTTTRPATIKRALIPRQVAEDYQTIRANLGLLNGNGMPKKLAVTSAGMREGKTTFAVNLATSMAKSGKKVLLIDGDLRKPDIARLLHLPKGSRGLQELLFGKNGDRSVCSIPSIGLDVLAADSRNAADAFELLALPLTAQHIDEVSTNYDHVIIDTPPVLAFPDALLWAKMADAVILTCFASQTTAPDLKEAKQKLAQLKVKILGTVLANVPISQGYYRYGYSYYAQQDKSRKGSRAAKAKNLLLPMNNPQDDSKPCDS
ncbi:MAG: polysaccharide biosynthesis tyrosine autokinase, partial [Planctomycetota bacterium]